MWKTAFKKCYLVHSWIRWPKFYLVHSWLRWPKFYLVHSWIRWPKFYLVHSWIRWPKCYEIKRLTTRPYQFSIQLSMCNTWSKHFLYTGFRTPHAGFFSFSPHFCWYKCRYNLQERSGREQERGFVVGFSWLQPLQGNYLPRRRSDVRIFMLHLQKWSNIFHNAINIKIAYGKKIGSNFKVTRPFLDGSMKENH